MPKARPSGASETAAFLSRNAVDSLPEGELERKLERAAGEGRPLRVKLGIDPTAPDIHLGHVVVLEKLREFQDAGHTVVLIIGDYTARVGDPSGQSALRPMLEPEQIDRNAATFQDQAFKVIDPQRTEMRRNGEWLDMSMDDLLRLVRRVTVARVLERDDFQQRIEGGGRSHCWRCSTRCSRAMTRWRSSRTWRWGAPTRSSTCSSAATCSSPTGRSPRRSSRCRSFPALDGDRRMSKSYGNYVGVTDPPEEMFGKLMSVPDPAMGTYYELLLGEEPDPGQPPVEAKRSLARRLVERFHGAGAGEAAEQHFDRLHKEHRPPEDLEQLTIDPGQVANGTVHLPALVAEHFGKSRSEARRLLEQGGIRLDGEPLGAESIDLEAERLDGAVLQVGKRQFRRIVVQA